MSKFGYILASFALFASLGINHIAGSSKTPRDLVSVRFCPETANNTRDYTPKETDQAQQELNKKFCRDKYIFEKDFFENANAYDNLPNAEIILWRKSDLKFVHWLLMTPVLCGVAYAVAWASLQNSVDNRTRRLERFKLDVKKTSAPFRIARNVLDNKERLTQEIEVDLDEQSFQALRVEENLLNVEQINEQLATEGAIRDRQIKLSLGEMDAKIAEFATKKQKEENEKAKLERLLNKTIQAPSATPKEIKEASPIGVSQVVKNQLKEALNTPENKWLLDIIKNKKPLILIGEMGSGKSWFAISIALARKILYDAPIEFIMDRHYEGENEVVWELLDAKNKAKDEPELPAMFEKSRLHWKSRIKIGKTKLTSPTQTIVDEFTNLRDIKNVENIKEEAELWFNMALSDPRKALDFVLIITHKDTNGAWGDKNADTRNANTILIEKYSRDGDNPLPNVTIRRGLRDSNGKPLIDIDQKIPHWFLPQELYDWMMYETVPKGINDDYEPEPQPDNDEED